MRVDNLRSWMHAEMWEKSPDPTHWEHTSWSIHLEDRHPDPKFERKLPRHRSSGIPMEYSDGDTESPPNDGDSVPRHPPWFPHRQMHSDRLY